MRPCFDAGACRVFETPVAVPVLDANWLPSPWGDGNPDRTAGAST